MKFALARLDNCAPEPASYCPEVVVILCILNGAHVPPDLLPLATVHRVNRANLPFNDYEGRPLTGQPLGCCGSAGRREPALADRNVVNVRLRQPRAPPDLADREAALAQSSDFIRKRQTGG